MRISVDTQDPGFSLDAYLYSVYLDGQEVSGCITADEEKGLCVVHEIDEKGQVLVDKNSGVLKTCTLYGKVEVRKS